VSSLVESINPTGLQSPGRRHRLSYGRLADDDEALEEALSLPGGERTSPHRATEYGDADYHGSEATPTYPTFVIDSDNEDENDIDSVGDCDVEGGAQHTITRKPLPELLSLRPLPVPPANYICPLTLQLMDDPVNDNCGHTFERRAILQWLDRSGRNDKSRNRWEAVCPISQKPLIPLGCTSCSLPEHDNHMDTIDSSSCYDRVLKRNTGLQSRIQEWKLEHSLYQGANAGYAKRQRKKLLSRSTITPIELNQHRAKIDCLSGGDTVDASDNSSSYENSRHNNTLSGFELMLLPQEREALKNNKKRSNKERENEFRSRWGRLMIGIVLVVLVVVGVYTAVTVPESAEGVR